MNFWRSLFGLDDQDYMEEVFASLPHRKGFVDVDIQYYNFQDIKIITKTSTVRLEVEETEKFMTDAGVEMSRIKVVDSFSHDLDMPFRDRNSIMIRYPRLVESSEITWLENPTLY